MVNHTNPRLSIARSISVVVDETTNATVRDSSPRPLQMPIVVLRAFLTHRRPKIHDRELLILVGPNLILDQPGPFGDRCKLFDRVLV